MSNENKCVKPDCPLIGRKETSIILNTNQQISLFEMEDNYGDI